MPVCLQSNIPVTVAAQTAYVALGANLGDPVATVNAAIASLTTLASSRLIAASSLYRTVPVGLKNQPDFINAVVALETGLSPMALLEALFEIEAQFGRSRSVPNAPRTLDLDLLLVGETVMGGQGGASSPDISLVLPHPRMHQRAFVLAPLLEIAPECRIPGRGSVRELLESCREQRIVKLNRPESFDIAASLETD